MWILENPLMSFSFLSRNIMTTHQESWSTTCRRYMGVNKNLKRNSLKKSWCRLFDRDFLINFMNLKNLTPRTAKRLFIPRSFWGKLILEIRYVPWWKQFICVFHFKWTLRRRQSVFWHKFSHQPWCWCNSLQ